MKQRRLQRRMMVKIRCRKLVQNESGSCIAEERDDGKIKQRCLDDVPR